MAVRISGAPTEAVEVVMQPDGRMDRRNAARYSGYAPKTFAQWASKGIGPRFVKPGGKCWYFRSDLDAWLAGGERAS